MSDMIQESVGLAAQKTMEAKMTDDAWSVQYSIKNGQGQDADLINFRGSNLREIAEAMGFEVEKIDTIFDLMVLVNQGKMSNGLLRTTNVQAPAGAPATQNSAPATNSTSSDLRCEHGVFKVNPALTKAGKPFMYNYCCPAYKCKPAEMVGNTKR